MLLGGWLCGFELAWGAGSLGKNGERVLQAVGGQALGPGVAREEKLRKTLERWLWCEGHIREVKVTWFSGQWASWSSVADEWHD